MNPSDGIQLQERDFELLRGLFESRVMTIAQISAIHFDGHREAARKRVRRLRNARLIDQRPHSPEQAAIFVLARKGFQLLVEHGMLSRYPQIGWVKAAKRARVSDTTLRHELDVLDVKAAFYAAIRMKPTLKIAEFTTWPNLVEFKARHPVTGRSVLVKPDGFIRLAETNSGGNVHSHFFFIEVDRSTETLDILATRVACYLDFYKRGGLAVRLGDTPSSYRRFPYRVLIVCKSKERRDNIAARLLQAIPTMRNFVWLGEITEVRENLLADVWVTPVHISKRCLLGNLKLDKNARP